MQGHFLVSLQTFYFFVLCSSASHDARRQGDALSSHLAKKPMKSDPSYFRWRLSLAQQGTSGSLTLSLHNYGLTIHSYELSYDQQVFTHASLALALEAGGQTQLKQQPFHCRGHTQLHNMRTRFDSHQSIFSQPHISCPMLELVGRLFLRY